jgi:hypothetical protein
MAMPKAGVKQTPLIKGFSPIIISLSIYDTFVLIT